MPTVYALDIRRKHKVRHNGVVHYAGSEMLRENEAGARASIPYGARCGTVFDGDATPAYLDDAADVVVTCVACASDRRRG